MSNQSTNHKRGRIVVIGTSCSGKTTLARVLAERLDCRHIELDVLHWRPNWESAPLEEFRALTARAVGAERWTLDGNYSKVRDIVWARATTLIWLNYPFPIIFGRALKRTVGRAFLREELFGGNRESFRRSFLSRDSILWWVITTYRRRRREYPQLFRLPEYAHLEVIEFGHPREAERFLDDLNLHGCLATGPKPNKFK